MMNCAICNKEIKKDCQYINGKYYHNNCIEKMVEENQRLKEKMDKVFQLLQLLHYKFDDNNVIHNEIEDIQKILKENKNERASI